MLLPIINKKLPLTVDKVMKIERGFIFKNGVADLPHPYYNWKLIRVKWVAIRIGLKQWTILYSWGKTFPVYVEDRDLKKVKDFSNFDIASFGRKLTNRTIAATLVPCTDEALDLYDN